MLIKDYIDELQLCVSNIDQYKVVSFADEILSKKKHRILIFGNGGSASIASHFTVDMMKNTNIECFNFNEASILTCLSNDFGYERWIEICLQKFSSPNDLAIFISSSGESANIINGLKYAKANGLKTLTLTGFSCTNTLHLADGRRGFWVKSENYNVVENCHQIILLGVFEQILEKLKC